MPITILDYVKSAAGEKDFYTAEDCLDAGVDILGGCQLCGAIIAAYNAYPSVTGYWRCADCIGDLGYPTIAAFAATFRPGHCPICGHPLTGDPEDTGSPEFLDLTQDKYGEPPDECGYCGRVLQP